MIIIALGANLNSDFGRPFDAFLYALAQLEEAGVEICQRSRLYKTAPVPYDPLQPDYYNAVIAVRADLDPHALLALLLSIEEDMGRVRSVKNAPRVIDLDLIAYHDQIIQDHDRLIVPHPRMHERLFVLRPLCDIDQAWNHPIKGQTVKEMMDAIEGTQDITVSNECLRHEE